jgi:hypothetical protein
MPRCAVRSCEKNRGVAGDTVRRRGPAIGAMTDLVCESRHGPAGAFPASSGVRHGTHRTRVLEVAQFSGGGGFPLPDDATGSRSGPARSLLLLLIAGAKRSGVPTRDCGHSSGGMPAGPLVRSPSLSLWRGLLAWSDGLPRPTGRVQA